MTLSQQQWNQFVSSAPGGSFLQSWEWGQMQKKLRVPYWRLSEEETAGAVAGVALVLQRQLPWGKHWLYVPRGPLFSKTSQPSETSKSSHWSAGLAGKLVSLAQRENAIFVRVEPSATPPTGWRKATNDVQPRHTLVLDLTQTPEELLGSMHQKTRYNIRLAEKKGVTIRWSRDPADLDHFLTISHDVSDRSAFSYHPDEYYRAMMAAHPTSVELALAQHEGDVLAVHILIAFGDTVTYVHGASRSHKRNLMAPHLLQWESIRRAQTAGYKKYDFFGVASPQAPPDHPWSGITKFKTGFGGQRVSYLGAYDYVVDPLWYWTYSTSRRARGLLR